jgi:hypothetical protein
MSALLLRNNTFDHTHPSLSPYDTASTTISSLSPTTSTTRTTRSLSPYRPCCADDDHSIDGISNDHCIDGIGIVPTTTTVSRMALLRQ